MPPGRVDGDGGTRFLEMARGVSPAQASRRAVSGFILAVGAGGALIAETLLGGIANIGGVFNDAWDFMTTLFTGPADIITTSAGASAVATTEFGVFSFIVGTGVVIGAFLLWDRSNVELPLVDRINFRGRD